MKKKTDDFIQNQKIADKVNLENLMNSDGLEYAHYVLQHRALTEIYGDGLKPVQRRILYAMYKMGSTPNTKTIKGATVSGEVIGKYHPHGNSSVEAAQENMGQDFNTRVPMFKIQGVLGTFTGSTAPSPRYYEIGINNASWELIKELHQKSVLYKTTELGDGLEPIFLPAKFPYNLINGGSGIAVGYASSMPPHNPTEVMNALIAYFKGTINSTKDIFKYIKGPDFPTGGEIVGIDGIKEYFENGTGSFSIRGKYNIEKLPKGRTLINFYELPYQISVSQIIESVDKLQEKNKLKEISEIKDLSDNNRGLSCAIYVKNGVNINKVIDDLFKFTPLQSKFAVNSTALVKGAPTSNIPILKILEGFCDFRKETYIRKITYKLEQIEKELHKLKGLLAILVNIDKAISIIRKSESAKIANENLQKTFKIDEEQANYILAMQLRQLTKADKNEIINKNDELIKEQTEIINILENENLLHQAIIKELEETKKVIADDRRTEILDITNEELKDQEKENKKLDKMLQKDVDCFVHLQDNKIIKSLEKNNNFIKTTSQGICYSLTNTGKLISFKVDSVHLDEYTSLNKDDKLMCLLNKNYPYTLIVTSQGNLNLFRNDKLKDDIFTKLSNNEEIIFATPLNEEQLSEYTLITVSEDGFAVNFDLSNIRPTGQGSGTIKGMNTKKCVSAFLNKENNELLIIGEKTIKLISSNEILIKGRGVKGITISKSDIITKAISVNLDKDEILLQGSPISLEISNRTAKGQKLPNGSLISVRRKECLKE